MYVAETLELLPFYLLGLGTRRQQFTSRAVPSSSSLYIGAV